MQTVLGVKRIIKKLLLVIVTTTFVMGSALVGETASDPFRMDIDLASFLEDGLFSAFSTESSYHVIDAFSMCNGSLLLDCVVSSEYGMRIHPRRRRRHFHTGIDLAAPKGSPIFAAADGVVMKAGRARGYGRMVELDHGFTWGTKYAHMKKIYVKKGQHVKKGDILGEVGSSGVSTGPHLHFEMLYFGMTVNPMNYFALLDNVTEPPFMFANR